MSGAMSVMNERTQTTAGPLARRLGKGLGWAAALGSLLWVGSRTVPRVFAPPVERAKAVAEVTPLGVATVPAPVLAALPATGLVPPCKDGMRVEGGVLADGRVVLNRAGITDLMELPGVGEKRARAIVALRERVGKFRSLRDLLRVRGIGARMLRRLESKAVLDAPSEGVDEHAKAPENVGRGA